MRTANTYRNTFCESSLFAGGGRVTDARMLKRGTESRRRALRAGELRRAAPPNGENERAPWFPFVAPLWPDPRHAAGGACV